MSQRKRKAKATVPTPRNCSPKLNTSRPIRPPRDGGTASMRAWRHAMKCRTLALKKLSRMQVLGLRLRQFVPASSILPELTVQDYTRQSLDMAPAAWRRLMQVGNRRMTSLLVTLLSPFTIFLGTRCLFCGEPHASWDCADILILQLRTADEYLSYLSHFPHTSYQHTRVLAMESERASLLLRRTKVASGILRLFVHGVISLPFKIIHLPLSVIKDVVYILTGYSSPLLSPSSYISKKIVESAKASYKASLKPIILEVAYEQYVIESAFAKVISWASNPENWPVCNNRGWFTYNCLVELIRIRTWSKRIGDKCSSCGTVWHAPPALLKELQVVWGAYPDTSLKIGRSHFVLSPRDGFPRLMTFTLL